MGRQRRQGDQMALNALGFGAAPSTTPTPWVEDQEVEVRGGGAEFKSVLDLASGPRSRLGKKKEKEEKSRQDSL